MDRVNSIKGWIATQVTAAKNMITAADAAEAAAAAERRSLTDEELKQFGYVEDEGGSETLAVRSPSFFTLETV